MLERVWSKGNPLTLLVGMQTGTELWRTVWTVLKKLKIELPHDPTIPLLDVHPRKPELKETCTPMFTAALSTARMWKQPRYPSAHEWIRKLWYIYTMNITER